jgi:membrane fusion protein, adhesin transport system
MAAPFPSTTRSLARHTAAVAVWVWLGVLLLMALWLAWFFLGRVNLVEVSRQARLETRQAPRPVSAALAGRVARSGLAIGQEVREGEVLVELDASAPQLRLAEEQVRQKGLAAQIAALRIELNALARVGEAGQQVAQAAVQGAQFRSQEAAAGLAFANEQARRLKEDSLAGGVAQVDALQAAAEARKLSASHEALNAEVRRLDADGRTRSAQAQAQLDNLRRSGASLDGEMQSSRALMARLQLDIEQHRLRAPVAGRIGEMAPLRVGDVVAAGQKFASVVPADELIVVAEFDPAGVLGRVRAGQAAQLRLEGFPWAQHGSIAATVSRVASEIRDGRVRVELTPRVSANSPLVLQHGLPGAIEIVVDQVSPALMLLRTSGQMLSTSSVKTAP